jgi:hypothetical protein
MSRNPGQGCLVVPLWGGERASSKRSKAPPRGMWAPSAVGNHRRRCPECGDKPPLWVKSASSADEIRLSTGEELERDLDSVKERASRGLSVLAFLRGWPIFAGCSSRPRTKGAGQERD